MIQSIFPKRNQELVELFEAAEHPRKVVCVPLDYAKKTHTALISDGTGRRLKGVFSVKNSPEGLEFLMEQVKGVCRKFAIDPKHVFFGGEACGPYALNFIHAIEQRQFLVLSVDPRQAKSQRSSFQASTDKLDLLGIAKVLLDQQGSTKTLCKHTERQLRDVTRHRAGLVRTRTALSNRIHSLVDQLFPGFLDETQSGIPAFSEMGLWLMEDRFSPRQLRARPTRSLVRQGQKKKLHKPEACIEQLKSLAVSVLPPVPEWVDSLQSALRHEVQLYRSLQTCIKQADEQSARLLAHTPAAMLTTIKGTAITLAASFAAEVGALAQQTSVRRLTSYAGVVPRVKQTGGAGQPARYGSVSRQSNHLLKNVVVQCANHMGQHGPADLQADYRRREARGQHADFGMARRYIRMAIRLMRDGQGYLPADLRECGDKDAAKAYYVETWPRLRDLWKKSGALEEAFEPKNPLGQWRACITTTYDIDLPV